jgi:DNA helicase-4
VEYYGIDREGNVPPYFSSRDGKTPSDTYMEGIKWKERLHEDKGTKLIAVFAYEKWEGTLALSLREKLESVGVKFQPDIELPISDDIILSIAKTFESLLNKIKSKRISIEDVSRMVLSDPFNAEENKLALTLFEPIFTEYQSSLKINGEIDFHDMINQAIECVKEGGYVHDYDYILIDEYQDISDSRFDLLSEMRKVKDFKIFSVGDDWQSIYGFTGSNLSYLYDFEKHWGIAKESKAETTYRFPEKLIRVSSKFIMRNPKQIPKQLSSKNGSEFSLIEVRGRNDEEAISDAVDKLIELPHGSSIFFLGRYDSDKKILFRNTKIEINGSKITINGREDLKISFLTVHGSKGLQADCVVILNNKDDIKGFPSKIADPAIVRLLDDNIEDFLFSEERRVYYVAMTRAKAMLILLTIDDMVSPFAKEILAENQDLVEKNYSDMCPKCGGRMVKRPGKYGPFMGCSNFPVNKCTHKEQIKNNSK